MRGGLKTPQEVGLNLWPWDWPWDDDRGSLSAMAVREGTRRIEIDRAREAGVGASLWDSGSEFSLRRSDKSQR